jgi:hypothetical protein
MGGAHARVPSHKNLQAAPVLGFSSCVLLSASAAHFDMATITTTAYGKSMQQKEVVIPDLSVKDLLSVIP